jgi:hypothetical protein
MDKEELEKTQIIMYRIELKGKTGEEHLDYITNILDNYCSERKLLLFVQQGIDFMEGFVDYYVNKGERTELIKDFRSEIEKIDDKIEIVYCH